MTELTGRIAQRFAQLAREGRQALIPYVVAGDPYADFTVALMHKLVEAGADIIELGVPFSDPMAEGPVIQKAHERALGKGISLRDTLAMIAEFRQQDMDTPVLLMGYANPVFHMGYAAFADAAKAAGLDALLTVDMPPEEIAELDVHLKQVAMNNILLVAPTTLLERIEKITEVASGFVYYVAVKGVTGAGHLDVAAVARHVAEIRSCSELPVAVGFGIKDATSAAAVARVADGVVVGSALVQLMADAAAAGDTEEAVCAVAAQFLAGLRSGIDTDEGTA